MNEEAKNQNETAGFGPTASISNLRQRAEIIKQLRQYFDERGFFHVETPILSHDIVVDRYLEPMSVERENGPGWLQTSPEFAMKRLVASQADSIYQIARVFRCGELGQLHNPEFTMLEWYCTNQSPFESMKFLGDLVEEILERPQTELLSYQQVFEKHLAIDPHTAEIGVFRAIAKERGLDLSGFADETDRDLWLNLLLARLIEPELGSSRPQIIFDWPASQSALAIIRNNNPPVAERFEIYVDGIELANGYHELLDADELALRNSKVNKQRSADGKRVLPESSRLLDAMRKGLPDCCGVALGVDRLVMLKIGATSIRDVIAFPFDFA